MNREIKFRAWDDLNKKWLLGYELPNLGGFSMMGETMAFGEYSQMLNSFSLEDWDNIKIMQFTGLKDKNGKDIYEGDVIKNERQWGVIVYKAPAFEVTVSADQSSLYTKEWIEACEVIGNIYENPELLGTSLSSTIPSSESNGLSNSEK